MPDTILAPAGAWQAAFTRRDGALLETIARIRSEEPADASKAIRWYAQLVAQASAAFQSNAERPMMVVRAPGRVNLLGTHIDHRGGRVNPIAVRELVLVVLPRDDGRVRLVNADPAHTSVEFSLDDLLPDGLVTDWADWTLTTPMCLRALGLLGHWSSYVRAALAYFTNAWGGPGDIHGFDLYAASELPQAAGLSSSSALVVAAAIAFHLTNGRDVQPLELAEACGQAEWYVGTRGGSGDQAAILLGKAGHVSHVDFFPMQVDWSPWPTGYSVVVCHSRAHAQKTANARSTFNERVATYAIALFWIKRLHPDWTPELVHLRDLLRLSLGTAKIYWMLWELPRRVMRDEIRCALPERREELERLFGTHDEPAEGYRVRDVCLYGLAECMRSIQLAECLQAGDIIGTGRLINLSHEGDRVTRLDESGERVPVDTGVMDEDLRRLITALESGSAEECAAAALALQPGGYACSSPALDELVDLARSVEGVLGAGLIGAGIGGCVEVIVKDEAIDDLRRALLAGYYEKHGYEPFIETMRPVEGAGALVLPR